MEYEALPPDPADPIRRSWQRCIEFGLTPEQRPLEVNASPLVLAEKLEANSPLLAFAQPVIENLYQQIACSSSMILLADNSGMILSSLGDADFVERAARASLAPGAIWSENRMGTNAIGTALHDQRTVAVVGDQHYLHHNRFLTCIATPILAPNGGLLGLIDISGHAEMSHIHAGALLQTTAEIIENGLIERVAGARLSLRFHPSAEALGTPLEGLLVFNETGKLLAFNRRAAAYLENAGALGCANFNACFAHDWNALIRHAASRGGEALEMRSAGGRRVVASAMLKGPVRPAPIGGPLSTRPAAAPGDEKPKDLRSLDLGDARMAEAIRRAMCIVDHDIPLLIQGETGSGKEVFAQAFHHSAIRRSGPFVAINCAAIPAKLIEAELFGYVDGAYTGSRPQGALGKLREADGGTLFLDEIGDMPLELQAVLLRVLETRRVTPLGGAEEAVDLSLVCASHQPLRELMAQGTFRADLFFRLSGMTIALPPLRERSDFSALVRQILGEERPQRACRVSQEAMRLLRRYPWPGNLRQLRNTLRLATALLGEADCLTPEFLPQEILDETTVPPPASGASQSLKVIESKWVQDAVIRHGGNISAAARELNITRTTLYRKLRQTEE